MRIWLSWQPKVINHQCITTFRIRLYEAQIRTAMRFVIQPTSPLGPDSASTARSRNKAHALNHRQETEEAKMKCSKCSVHINVYKYSHKTRYANTWQYYSTQMRARRDCNSRLVRLLLLRGLLFVGNSLFLILNCRWFWTCSSFPTAVLLNRRLLLLLQHLPREAELVDTRVINLYEKVIMTWMCVFHLSVDDLLL